METKEALLNEEYRPLYRSFRSAGLSEAAAFEAAIGRAPRADALAGELDVDRRAIRYEAMGMTREAAEHAAAGREFSSFQDARHAELRRIAEVARQVAAEEANPKPKGKTKATKATPNQAPALATIVEKAVARALADAPAGTSRAQLTEQARRLVEADIADIEAGRRPSARLGR